MKTPAVFVTFITAGYYVNRNSDSYSVRVRVCVLAQKKKNPDLIKYRKVLSKLQTWQGKI